MLFSSTSRGRVLCRLSPVSYCTIGFSLSVVNRCLSLWTPHLSSIPNSSASPSTKNSNYSNTFRLHNFALYSCTQQSSMPCIRRKGKTTTIEQQRIDRRPKPLSSSVQGASSIEECFSRLDVAFDTTTTSHSAVFSTPPASRFGSVKSFNHHQLSKDQHNETQVSRPKSYTTKHEEPPAKGPTSEAEENFTVTPPQQHEDKDVSQCNFFEGCLDANFTVDNQTYCKSQIRATFYPKFENEKSDQEIRTRMIEMVSHKRATLEVSLKHSGSLFMYSGAEGGAYAKNSFGNMYTAVGVFVLSRMFAEAWGIEARKKQKELNGFLEKNFVCISMELVTAVLGDHGQRPLQDYAVVTAVTELGNGKPKFYSTPEIIAFCRKWRLPTNHVWLFSTRKSVTSFFAAYDALCEEGTATTVCKALDEIAEISVPGSKDHVKAQGEILEGLVARVVSPGSSKDMDEVLSKFPFSMTDEVKEDLGPSLREICAANRTDEQQQIIALLQNAGTSLCPSDSDWFGDGRLGSNTQNPKVLSNFLRAHPSDFSTTKLQELIRLMRQRHFPAAFKCYPNYHKIKSRDSLHFRMVIHVFNDSVFRRYQQEMKRNPGLWPLYRGFFVDINLFKTSDQKANKLAIDGNSLRENMNDSSASCTRRKDDLGDEDANLMIKLKFLPYKLRTFLIRNGLSVLFKEGPSAYRTYYMRQMKSWGTSAEKQRKLSDMLDEWAVYIRRKCGNKPLSASIYLSEAEPFLEQYAKCSLENQALVGSAGNLVRSEDFLATVKGIKDEEGDLIREGDMTPTSPIQASSHVVPKDEGLIIFFPGIPGCAKSALCRELLLAPGGLGDGRPLHSLMGDVIKGKYWQKVAEERKRNPYAIILADKNAPNEEVWKQVEHMCRSTKTSAVPIVPSSEGTSSNPFSIDALAVFVFRVLQRVDHPGNLDRSSPNVGYVLLMFYHLYEGKDRREFESELSERFGSLVQMPLLKDDRKPMPEPVKAILEEGIVLFKLHSKRHGRLEPSKGTYVKEWIRWENEMRDIILGNGDYLNSIQVPLDVAVSQVLEQLKYVARGEYKTPSAEKRKLGNIVFAAVTLSLEELKIILDKVCEKCLGITGFLEGKDLENGRTAHVTLAHKRSHGVTAVASYGIFIQQKVPVELTAFLFSDKLAAFEARLGKVEGEQINSLNQWPHVTIWTAPGASAKEASTLPILVSEGKATRIDIKPSFTVSGTLNFY